MKYRALLAQMSEVRSYLLASIQGLTEEQLLEIPAGFKNNILWNVGHVITDNCTMLYPPAGHEFPLPAQYLHWFAPGTRPADWDDVPPFEEVFQAGVAMRDKLVDDCSANRMENYEATALDDGVVLRDIAQAIAHCNLHEAMHLGVVTSYLKLIRRNY